MARKVEQGKHGAKVVGLNHKCSECGAWVPEKALVCVKTANDGCGAKFDK